MVSKKQEVRVKGSDGSEASLHSQSTDTPILPPTDYLRELNELDKNALAWLMAETSKEAQARRDLDNKKVTAIIIGQCFGLIFGLFALIISAILAHMGDTQTASIIAGSTIVTIVLGFIAAKNK